MYIGGPRYDSLNLDLEYLRSLVHAALHADQHPHRFHSAAPWAEVGCASDVACRALRAGCRVVFRSDRSWRAGVVTPRDLDLYMERDKVHRHGPGQRGAVVAVEAF